MKKPDGYCYSTLASEALEPATMSTKDKVLKALERAKRRHNIGNFKCWDET
jgi:hypothetical protein